MYLLRILGELLEFFEFATQFTISVMQCYIRFSLQYSLILNHDFHFKYSFLISDYHCSTVTVQNLCEPKVGIFWTTHSTSVAENDVYLILLILQRGPLLVSSQVWWFTLCVYFQSMQSSCWKGIKTLKALFCL